MAELRTEKHVATLPGTLTANTVYYVKNGSVIDIYITNNSGTIIAYPLNTSSGSVTYEDTIINAIIFG